GGTPRDHDTAAARARAECCHAGDRGTERLVREPREQNTRPDQPDLHAPASERRRAPAHPKGGDVPRGLAFCSVAGCAPDVQPRLGAAANAEICLRYSHTSADAGGTTRRVTPWPA